MTPDSALYTGTITHTRSTPAQHRFRYQLFMTALNLDALEQGALRGWLNPTRRFALVRFRRADHHGDAHKSLRGATHELLQRTLTDYQSGPIVLLTHLRQFGHRFNPVSFYFCFKPNGERLSAIVLEVKNTPWGEQHCYVLDCRDQHSPYTFRQNKEFTVSPFLPMDMEYRFRFEFDAQHLRIHMANWHDANCVFNAQLNMRAEPLTARSLARALLRHPLMTWKISATIHWQALRLLLKRVPFLGYQPPTAIAAAISTRTNNTERAPQHVTRLSTDDSTIDGATNVTP